MFADTCGKDDCVNAVHGSHVCADVFFCCVAEHFQCQLAAIVTVVLARGKVAEVGFAAGNTTHAALLVEVGQHFGNIFAFFLCKILHRRKVDVAAAAAHGYACKRCKAHACVDALTSLNSRD